MKRVKLDPATGDILFDANGDAIEEDAPEPVAAPAKIEPSRIPAGASGAETAARAVLPRSFKAAEEGGGILRQAGAGALDAISAGGRAVAAATENPINPYAYPGLLPGAPKSGEAGTFTAESGRKFANSMADTDGTTIPGRIIRDPALLPSIATGGALAAGVKGLGLTGLRAASAVGGAMGAETAAIHQADNLSQGRDFDLKGAAIETGIGAALPGAGSLASKGVAATGRGLKKVGANVVESVIKPLDAARGEGFDIENFFKHKLGGSSLLPEKWMRQSQEKLATLRKGEGEKLGKALKESGAEIDGAAEIEKVRAEIAEEVKAGNLDPKGAEAAFETWKGRIEAVTDPKTGMIPAETLNNVKRRAQHDARSMYRAKNLGTDAHATEKEVFAQKIGGNVRATLEREIEGVKAPNLALAETKPFKRATQKAGDRLAKNDGVSLKGSILASGIGAALGGVAGPAGVGAGAAIAPAAMYVADKALKNPAIGTGMYRLGEGLERIGEAGDRMIRAPFAKRPGPEPLSAETQADLDALRQAQDLNDPGVPGRKVIHQPNARRPLNPQPVIEPPKPGPMGGLHPREPKFTRRPLDERPAQPAPAPARTNSQGGLPPREGSLRFPRRPLDPHDPEAIQVDHLGDVRRAEDEAALAPLPPRQPSGPIIAPNSPPFMEPPKYRETLNNMGRRPLELKPAELREKMGLEPKKVRKLSPTGMAMAQMRYNKAHNYLNATNGQKPSQAEIYDFIESLGENPVPALPTKPKIEREFKGRRDSRHLEFIDHAIRGGVSELPTKAVRASEGPATFTLQGATFKKMKPKWDHLVTYKDEQGRMHDFDIKKEWIHMDPEGEVPF